MGIFSKIHAYVLIKTRREFIHLRRLLMQTRRLLEILEIGCFVTMNFYFYLLIFYLLLNLHILLLGQNILRTFSMKKSVFINPFVDRGFKILFGQESSKELYHSKVRKRCSFAWKSWHVSPI